jgi:hypothetical protein
MATRLKKSLKRKSAPKKPPRGVRPTAGKALYLYGISPGSAKRKSISTPGIDGTGEVHALKMDTFLCWVAPVNAQEFGANLNANMENLEWLADASVRHQRAVSEIAENADILPTRFGTVFLSEQSLREHVRGQKKALQSALKRVSGADEWGVKVFREVTRASAAVVTAASGRDYLQKKATLMHSAESRGADEEIKAFAAELAKISRATAATGKVSGTQRDLMWQASFLLPRAKQKQWDTVLKRWANRWGETRRIEATGPWPPYSFVSS